MRKVTLYASGRVRVRLDWEGSVRTPEEAGDVAGADVVVALCALVGVPVDVVGIEWVLEPFEAGVLHRRASVRVDVRPRWGEGAFADVDLAAAELACCRLGGASALGSVRAFCERPGLRDVMCIETRGPGGAVDLGALLREVWRAERSFWEVRPVAGEWGVPAVHRAPFRHVLHDLACVCGVQGAPVVFSCELLGDAASPCLVAYQLSWADAAAPARSASALDWYTERIDPARTATGTVQGSLFSSGPMSALLFAAL
jgi:hypothetical protein